MSILARPRTAGAGARGSGPGPCDDAPVIDREPLRQEVAGVAGQVSAAWDEAAVRGEAAWDALRGARVGPPVAVRRWPWALAAAGAGAAAGVLAAVLLARLRTADPPDAVDPDEVRAVIG